MGSTQGVKHDAGKLPMHLIPTEALEAIATVLKFGQEKYGARNWERGFNWSRAYGATLRHLNAWWSGESVDPESGESHLIHALAEVAFLVAFEKRNVGEDDREGTFKGSANLHSHAGSTQVTPEVDERAVFLTRLYHTVAADRERKKKNVKKRGHVHYTLSTSELVEMLAKAHFEGVSSRELAKEYGVSYPTVRNYQNRYL